ncbi:hypothetical protein E4U21_003123 [Claviceps maximensis]|nr:hypothetical protein E4U21_003123 [Claviceps maximensis]
MEKLEAPSVIALPQRPSRDGRPPSPAATPTPTPTLKRSRVYWCHDCLVRRDGHDRPDCYSHVKPSKGPRLQTAESIQVMDSDTLADKLVETSNRSHQLDNCVRACRVVEVVARLESGKEA